KNTNKETPMVIPYIQLRIGTFDLSDCFSYSKERCNSSFELSPCSSNFLIFCSSFLNIYKVTNKIAIKKTAKKIHIAGPVHISPILGISLKLMKSSYP